MSALRTAPKVAILAGGLGTRLSEETAVRPKPMVEIGGMPILWHIMKFYSHYGYNDFVIIGGYKVDFIRDFFLNFRERTSDFTLDMRTGTVEYHSQVDEDWRVSVIDTGKDTMTGGRLKRARHLLGQGTFLLTYGDGLSNVPIDRLVDAHRQGGHWCTLTAVNQPGRYGALRIDATVWEEEPMNRLIEQGKLGSFRHDGYWQSMDSLRDKQVLELAWADDPPWKVWSEPPRKAWGEPLRVVAG
jgi:glucose-1-phosphate cytidylyltransferase